MSKQERTVRLVETEYGDRPHISLDGQILCQASQTNNDVTEVDRSENICSNCKRWGRKIGVLEDAQ